MRSFEGMTRAMLAAERQKLYNLKYEMVGTLYPGIVQGEINRINELLAGGLKSPDRLADTNSNEESDMARKKAHRIIVKRFTVGSTGELITEGFIFRHGEVLPREVPGHTGSGCLTPQLVTADFLLVKIAGAYRFLTPPVEGANFVVVLAEFDPAPSGLYLDCPHCRGKGYLKAGAKPGPDISIRDFEASIGRRRQRDEVFEQELDRVMPGRGGKS